MKKQLLAWMVCLASGASVMAQNGSRVEVFEPQGALLDSLYGAFVQGVSYNGEWAVGHGTEYTNWSFIWNRTTGEYQLIRGSYENVATASGVSNDGTVVGAFYKDVNGDGGLGCMLPGVWKDGVWTELPMELTFTPVEGLEASVNGEARFISADGSVITGYIMSYSFERNFYDDNGEWLEKRNNVGLLRPAVWTRLADGSYTLGRKWKTLPTGDDLQQGIWSNYGSSQDGIVLSVVADHPTGSRSPGVMIDGELTRVYGKKDLDLSLDITQYFYDGVSASVSPNGKYVPGYWDPKGNGYEIQGFVYDTETQGLEELEGWGAATVALDDGTLFGFDGYIGTATIRTADKSFNGTLDKYLRTYYGGYQGNLPQTIFSVSADGRTIGGWYAIADGIGMLMIPTVVLLEGAPGEANGIEASEVETPRSIIVWAGEVIAPLAVKVELFSAQGALLAVADVDRLSLDGLQGVVIAKATYADGKQEIRKLTVK